MPSKRTFKNPRTHTAILDRNFSDRIPGVDVDNVAVHTTESHPRPGVTDVRSIYQFFNTPGVEASAHYVIQGVDIWQLVPLKDKAWTIGHANSFTINLELIGFAAFSAKQWLNGDNYRTLKSAAKVIAYLERRSHIPIQRGAVGSRAGVCVSRKRGAIRHSDVTKAGFGTHTDPGRAFPLKTVLRLARWYAKHGWLR